MRKWPALVLLVLISTAQAEEHDHGKLGIAGEFYSKWKVPEDGKARWKSCCNRLDCYATAIQNKGGIWYGRHRETGAWVVIPNGRLEENASDERITPDGQSHMCANPNGVVFCAVRGEGI